VTVRNSAAFAWTDADVARALNLAEPGRAGTYRAVSTDSRSVESGDLFVALVGDNFDGHDFVPQALASGATGVVVSGPVDTDLVDRTAEAPFNVYRVADTVAAYGALAGHRRAQLPAKVVGITGSSGKTTTKDLTSGAVSASLRTHATQGNYNNRIGLPRTLLEAPVDAEVLVLEMGTNQPGEIGSLAEVAKPDIGVVTTVSESHLEGLGSLEGVLNEKLELLRSLGVDGVALVGESPAILRRSARDLRGDVRVAGLSADADPDLRAADLEVLPQGSFRFKWQGLDVALRIPGEAAVVDALLALGVAQALGVPAEAAARGVESIEPGWLRGEVRRLGSLTLILDCYNANPESVRAAIRTLERMPTSGRRILVLGSMLELGAESEELHTRVLADAAHSNVDAIYASGLFAEPRLAAGSLPIAQTRDIDALADRLATDLAGDETVLLKASRGVRLEGILPRLEAAFGPPDGEPASGRGGV